MELLAGISQFRDYLLGGAAVLVLIGIAGGGKLQVKDFALGPVEWPIRLGSFLFGVVCLGLVVTMPPSTSELETIDVSGTIEFNAQEVTDFQIQLTPKYAVYETEVQSAGGNTGTFRFVKKLPKGQYTLFVIEKGEISDKQDISLDSKKKILIAEKNTRVSGDRFSIRQGNLLEEARIRYSTSQKWIERAKVIGVLASHARNDETVKQELMDMLKAAHLSMQEKELAIFVLSELGESQTQPLLEALRKDEAESTYVRLRAAGYSWQIFGDCDAETFLLHYISHERFGVRTAAAVNISRKSTRKACVIERLIQGLKSKEPYARERARESLIRLTRQGFGAEEYAKWEEWWNKGGKDEFTACPGDQAFHIPDPVERHEPSGHRGERGGTEGSDTQRHDHPQVRYHNASVGFPQAPTSHPGREL